MPSLNLLTRVAEIVNDGIEEPLWTVRAFVAPNSQSDLVLMALAPGPKLAIHAELAVSRLHKARLITHARCRRGKVFLRLANSAIEHRAAALEHGEWTFEEDCPRRHATVVHFCDPNATKALHIGHLRNIALGNAISSLLAHAGEPVQRRCVVGDIGHNMAQALTAIWPVREHIDEITRDGRVKVDHLVGSYYAGGTASQPPVSEPTAQSDAPPVGARRCWSEEIAGGMLSGDPEIVHTWRRVRDYVIEAQAVTLAKLGVSFDRIVYESDFASKTLQLVQLGVTRGLFHPHPDGRITYETGRESFPSVPLLAADGMPTQHMRTIAYWVLAHTEMPDAKMIRVCGEEWHPHTLATANLIPMLAAPTAVRQHPATVVFHDMVKVDDTIVKSSRGDAPLIDDLLAQIAASERVRALVERRVIGGEPSGQALDDPTRIAGIIAMAYFLIQPASASIAFAPLDMTSERASLGWAALLAYTQVRSRTSDPGDATDDPAYRFVALQADVLCEHLVAGCARYEVSSFARCLLRLALWHRRSQDSVRTARAARTLIAVGMAALGLWERA
jgi:arginyl-tRNA synthetase